ncbi:S24 family peptidase [Methylomonas montana]|uniref:LexA family transcriptional regulator n=1 Tax=Methylomonas montana TaxID=3058963 RepID=UPI002657DE37|nr:S24 family peptidase [Methylomonas montana]WKJ88779.1 S24 family peptidase [Methylomonas montana]
MFMAKNNNTLPYLSQRANVFAEKNTDTYAHGMSTLREILEDEMSLQGLNDYDLEAKSKVPQPTIQRIRSGKHGDPRSTTVKKLAFGLGLTEAQLRGIEPRKHENRVSELAPPQFKAIRYGSFRLQAGVIGFAVDYHGDEQEPVFIHVAKLQREGLKPETLIAAGVTGDSMETSLYDGDTVIIDTSKTTPKDGDVYAINYEGELLIKRMIRDAGQWWLQSDNPDKNRHPNKLCSGDLCLVIGKVVIKESTRI